MGSIRWFVVGACLLATLSMVSAEWGTNPQQPVALGLAAVVLAICSLHDRR